MHDGAEIASSPVRNPSASSPRCEGVFAVVKRPVAPSNNTRSVKVPPTSTAMTV
jgi:hypothetical protein